MEVVIIRHGQTELNKENRYLGRTDVPLAPEGRVAAEEKRKEIKEKCDYEVVFSSPMIRCLETAKILAPDYEPIVIDELKEIDFGDFEGKNYIELSDNSDYQRYIDSGGTLPFPNGESREGFIERSVKGYNRCIQYMKDNNYERGLIVLHGGSIMAIMSSITGQDYYSFRVPNISGYSICDTGRGLCNI